VSGPASGLFVSDVDGTLVTPDKQLTPAALAAGADLRAAGVPYTLVSSRPPRGMAAVVRAMGVTLPFAAFNGGSLVGPDMKLIEARRLAPDVARQTLAMLDERTIEVFVFADDAWLLRDPHGQKTDRERHTVGFEPTVVENFEPVLGRIDKIVGVSDDPGPLDLAEADLRLALAGSANIERSQAYYLDITHPLANKGEAVRLLAQQVGTTLADTVVLGDMTNDIAMFRVAGFAIAMGQAPPPVKAAAAAVTLANTEDGFAHAVRTLVLPRLASAPVAGAPR
jgi:Cof subfamily protein (haloacid dehalogenase superfamily)